MPSSDALESTTGYFRGLIGGLMAVFALFSAVMLTVDPLGEGSGNAICPVGPKTVVTRGVKILLPARFRPQSIMLGTSRVHRGFDSQAMQLVADGPIANLGVASGYPADFVGLTQESLGAGRLQQVFVGLDFRIFFGVEAAKQASPPSQSYWPWLARKRAAYLSSWAIRALPAGLRDCRATTNADGSPLHDTDGASPGGERIAEDLDLMAATFRSDASGGEATYLARMAELRTAIRSWRQSGLVVVLFAAPYRKELLNVYREAGLADDFERFHADFAELAKQEGVPFIDLHSQAAIARLGLPECPGGGIGCHFIDMTHYSPTVARRIAPLLRAAASTAR